MKILGKYPSLRLRRNRKYDWTRRLVAENNLTVNDLIFPIFVTEGKNKIESIKGMPGIYRYSVDRINNVINKVSKLKIPLVAIFPHTPNNKKNSLGSEALNEDNLVCQAIRNHGHDGILKRKEILNDETVEILSEQAVLQAEMGCDIIAPSDMMDGRVGVIRKALDKNNFKNVQILSYAAKYASNFYGPFREAIGSKKKSKINKKSYQMDYKNSNEALREVALDIKEGADFVMIKPGLPYLDVIKSVKENFKIPVFVYQVSGEYSMIANAIKKGIVDSEAAVESLMSFKRSGASAIVTYFALDIAKKISN